MTTHSAAMTPVRPSTGEHSVVHPLGLDHARITDGAWAQWQRDNREITIPHVLAWLEKDGTVDNLRRLDPRSEDPGDRRGLWFTDSDLYKHLEGIAWENGRAPSDHLTGVLRDIGGIIARAQEPDGYLNSYVQAGLDVRWENLVVSHEHYCIGHLVQAAIADVRAGGSVLMPIALKAAERIVADFAHERRLLLDGHEEIEMSLVELYRETGRGEFLALAQQFIDLRGSGRLRSEEFDAAYYQDATPVREQHDVVGHAVRAVYLLCGIVDVYLETGDRSLLDAALAQWDTMMSRKTYLTGAFGSRFEGEAFGDERELPPDLAYGETCATIGAMMAAWRLLLATGESRFADAIERSLYNLFSASTGVDRTSFFYSNPAQRRRPLPPAPTGERPSRAGAPGTRPEWFKCACCPPNIVRTVASLGAFIATESAGGVQLHQYLPARLETRVADLELTTDYPNDGQVRVRVVRTAGQWELAMRIPHWAGDGVRVEISTREGSRQMAAPADAAGYFRMNRAWEEDDEIMIHIPIEPRLTAAHPAVDGLRGTLAVERGPVVYALESPDQADGVDLNSVEISADDPLLSVPGEVVGREVMVVHARGFQRDDSTWGRSGYASFGEEPPVPARGVPLTFIPYALWANRGPSVMRVHVPWRGGAETEVGA